MSVVAVMFRDQTSPSDAGRALPPHVAEFYDAYVARDASRIEALLHNDIKWQITGPSDQFDFYGARCGKQEVIELIVRIIPCYFLMTGFDFGQVLVQGGRVATCGRIRARQRDTGRSLSFRFAHFMHFVEGRLIDFRVISDTFDLAQQLVGHSIDVSQAMQETPLEPAEDLSIL
jgi:ketosteroid isomerase-like protein